MGGKAEKIDILFISTGNEILSKRMEEGEFARDVYERISGERIEAPSLVPRYEDVPLLVRHFLRDRPDSPLDPYRFSLAMVLREIVIRKKVQSVRTLQGYVGKAVSLSLPLRLASQEAESHLYEKARLRDVLIEAGFPDRELPKKAWVARQLNMKSRSQLSDTRSPWPGIWNSVVRELEFESSEAALSNKDGKS